MKVAVYNSVIDKMLNGIKARFSQDTLRILSSVQYFYRLSETPPQKQNFFNLYIYFF